MVRVDIRRTPDFDHAGYMGGAGFADIHAYRTHGSGFAGDIIHSAVPVLVHAGMAAVPGAAAMNKTLGGIPANLVTTAAHAGLDAAGLQRSGSKRRRRN